MSRAGAQRHRQRLAETGWRWFGRCMAWMGYVFLVLPSLIVIPIAFSGSSELSFPPKTFSLELFREFFTDPGWTDAAIMSLIASSLTTVLSLAISLPAAYALVRGRLVGKKLLETLSLAPMLVPTVVLGLGMYMGLSKLGLVDSLLGVVLGHTVFVTPFVIVALTSGLRQTDPALENVALMMGASRRRIFFEVVLPQIRPSIVIGALFAFLISFDEVIIAYFITGPDSTTLPVRMYSAIRWEISPVLAAVSALLTGISLLVCLGVMRLQAADKTNQKPTIAPDDAR
ncbi:ABC transporter permease [Salinisphaera sp. T31B1]|uniref:ABC transporter permease n=1 Tax=Salinisphaera sp. T31B1 TaxID=727963 RepID=UPI0033422AB6